MLENIDTSEMGWHLLKGMASFALYIGEIWAILSSLGNMPSEKDKLASRFNGRAIWSETHYDFEVTQSIPGEPYFKWPITILISGTDTGVKT